MDLTPDYKERADQIVALFKSAFTDSEGANEGQLIGQLAKKLLSTTRESDLFAFSALDAEAVVGTIIFTRLTYPGNDRTIITFSPVLVATSQQGK